MSLNVISLVVVFIVSLRLLQLSKQGPDEKMMKKHEKKTGAPMTEEDIAKEKAKFKKGAIFGICMCVFFGAWEILEMLDYLPY